MIYNFKFEKISEKEKDPHKNIFNLYLFFFINYSGRIIIKNVLCRFNRTFPKVPN